MLASFDRTRPIIVAALLAALGALLLSQGGPLVHAGAAGVCPPGYQIAKERPLAKIDSPLCVLNKHPETLGELDQLAKEWDAKRFAGSGKVNPSAARMGIGERALLATAAAKSAIAGTGGTWQPHGKGPLIVNDERYPSVNGLGFVYNSGRIDSLDYDPAAKRLFATVGTGGVWASDDLGKNWRSIGDALPTQMAGAVAWSSADNGTVIMVSGEPLNGGNTYTGFGAFRTTDLGKTWQQAKGVPDGALGYQVAVDSTAPNIVYIATSRGLYRSVDAGKSYANVRLPTGECAGKTDVQRCIFANWVTDVAVQAPDKFGHKGGRVLAAVGFRHGPKFLVGTTTPMAPWNGIYRSETGAPGTFKKLAATGFAEQYRIGRTELGVADGLAQNHDYVYAIVQDAELLNGGILPIDSPEDLEGIPFNTVLNGVYVSSDFGDTWTVMGDTVTISENPTTGSALAGPGQAQLYAPGIQAWYNAFVSPDPTRQNEDGIPTRVTFGLEEVWQNESTDEPQNGASNFKVIGKYYSGNVCLLLDLGQPACPNEEGLVQGTTTHPDQHDAIWVPDGKGGVTFVVGNDGGIYTQHVEAGQEVSNDNWGEGANHGFNTLLPYDVAMAKDGTVWAGLQDNGHMRIDPKTQKQYETFGGDGGYAAVDPDNSDVAYEEYVGGDMRVTTDGGSTWSCMTPNLDPLSPLTGYAKFINPFVMDPTDANHLMTSGRWVVETNDGPNTHVFEPPLPFGLTSPTGNTCQTTWTKVFDLGTKEAPGVDPGPTFEAIGEGTPNTLSNLDLQGDAAYVGYCGPCNLLNQPETFASGIATNVGGSKAPKRLTSDGWHIATAKGLPERYITGIEIDPSNPKIVYVALGGYENRQWVPPGSFGDKNKAIGSGHVFKSTDAGETFTDISGKLPNMPAFSILKRGNQLIVGGDAGVFISSDLNGSKWSVLGNGLPVTAIVRMQLKPGDPNLLAVATYGRGIYTYRFPAGSAVKPAIVKGSKTTRKPSGRQLPATGVASKALGALLLFGGAAVLARSMYRARLKN